MAVQSALGMLEEAGFTPIVCHAQGKGDRAMEEMIRDGAFHGVLDICIGGVIEHLFKGNRDPGPDRLMAAVETGIPMVLAPCGLDILSYGGRADMLEQDQGPRAVRAGRAAGAGAHHRRRTAPGRRRDRAAPEPGQGPVDLPGAAAGLVVAGQGGPADLRPGGRRRLRRPAEGQARRPSRVKEVDLHLYTPEFARVAVDEFVRLFESARTRVAKRKELQP